ncbi:DUF1294 domain-containing protein [Streptococcus dentapri]|uniref:DUF1294 domain-containing protein n=1 Tax=Streptococcus dentapri TaxID=573564 RepID=A0ABV8D2C9_9STRE
MQLLGLFFIIWNLLTFLLYGLDKRRAVRGEWRIPERILLLMTLSGAGLGAYLAGKLFRHKTSKWYFRWCWYLGILIDAALTYILWGN